MVQIYNCIFKLYTTWELKYYAQPSNYVSVNQSVDKLLLWYAKKPCLFLWNMVTSYRKTKPKIKSKVGMNLLFPQKEERKTIFYIWVLVTTVFISFTKVAWSNNTLLSAKQKEVNTFWCGNYD
jgi:hypothetical protein